MRRRWSTIILAAVVVASIVLAVRWWRQSRLAAGSIDWVAFLEQEPWLRDVSAWSQEVHLDSQEVTRQQLGCYPLGNGHVFTTLGLRLPLNTMENAIGPSYQKQQGFFGHWSVGLEVKGRPVPLPAQRVQRVLKGGVLRTTCGTDGAVLDTYDFVPPEQDVVARLVTVKNTARRAQRMSAILYVRGLPLDDGDGRGFARGSIRIVPGVVGGGLSWREASGEVSAEGVPEADTPATGADVVVPFGRVPPAQTRAKLLLLAIGRDPQGTQALLEEAQAAAYDLLADTGHWWRSYYEGCVRVATGDKRVDDLLSDQALIIQTQQALPGGGFSPMYAYTYCWARDSNGPVRYLLACGKFEEVRRALDFFYKACARKQQIKMNHALDLDVSGPTPEVEWAQAPVEPAEAPSFLVLQHYWYWKHTGEGEPVREHWDYLRRCLEGQDLTNDLRLPFHGDETYRFPGYRFFETTEEQPSDYVSLHLYSADSAFEYVKAAEALAEMAPAAGRAQEATELRELAGRVREATERYYWQDAHGFYAPAMSRFTGERYQCPFANVNLRPLWIGYSLPEEPRARQNVLNSLRHLWREDGTADTTPSFGYTVGMTPGMVLYNLAAIDHPEAAKAFEGVLEAFSPSGGMSEMLTPQNDPAGESDPWGKTRIRPWEGGINAEALLHYLTGFEPDAPNRRVRLMPHLAPGQTRLTVERLRIGEELLDLSVTDEGGKALYTLTHEGKQALTVDLVASLPASRVTAVLVAGEQLRKPEVRDNGLGRTHVWLSIRLKAGENARVSISHEPKQAGQARLARAPFAYSPPPVGSANTVLVTHDEEMAARWRQKRPGLFVMDSEIAFPAEYLEDALLGAGGGRRADELILDVSAYPGAFKSSKWWGSGPGAGIVKRFETAGGKVTRVEGRPKPPPALGREGD